MKKQVKLLFGYFLGLNNKFRFQAKIVHWEAATNNHHVYADDLHDLILGIEDSVAEIIGGISKSYNFQDFQLLKETISEIRRTSDFAEIEILKRPRLLPEFIDAYLVFVQKFYRMIPEDAKYAGLKSEFENTISKLNVLKDLSNRA